MRRGRVQGAVRPTRHRRRSERGLTLIEMMIAIAIMSVGFVSLLATFDAAERSSAVTQGQSTLEVAARQLSDYMRSRDQVPYVLCATPSSYSIGISPPAGVKWSIQNVYLSTGATRNGASISSLQSCGSKGDWGVQEVKFQVWLSPALSCATSTQCLTRTVWKGST